jgi:Carboxypeptidase regulatory-like domain
MMLRLDSGSGWRVCRLALVPVFAFFVSVLALAQTSSTTGRITGKVVDDKGAPVADARVTISTPAATAARATTNEKGEYSAENLLAGSYNIRVEAKGFETALFPVDVNAGSVSDGSVKLVTASELQVDTDSIPVKQVIPAGQMPKLPLDGRSPFAIAQYEPGVQILDGSNVDPTKTGYTALSLESQSGRNVRITMDGADVTDETVGATAIGIPLNGIQEFAVEQSTLDVTTDLTPAGAVNITSKRGTNAIHGDAFGLFRDSKILSAQMPNPFDVATGGYLKTPYQRNDEGASIGAPIIKDKAYIFLSGERTLQHLAAPVSIAAPFTEFSGTYQAPLEEDAAQGRIDYTLSETARLFGRINYSKNADNATFFPGSFQVYSNHDIARNGEVGADFDAHGITHSIRASYLKVQSNITDATRGSSLPFANYPVSINIGNFTVGPNALGPQTDIQSDMQVRYDGLKVMGNHNVHFGVGYNRIQVGGFTNQFAIAPQLFGTSPNLANSDPTATLLTGMQVIVGNGQGYASTQPAFGFPAGELGPDNRVSLYLLDHWKASQSVTLSYGLRWERDTNRTDSNLPAIAELNNAFPGLGNQVRQPNHNFAPQVGLAWDPKGTGRTVVRMGAGMYYENMLFNNLRMDRALRSPTGSLLSTPTACWFGTPLPIPISGGTISVDSVEGRDPATGRSYCADTIDQAGAALAAFEKTYQADTPFSTTTANPNFVGSLLASGQNIPLGLLAPNYQTPRAYQMNIGFSHEMRPGLIVTADFLRNVETHGLLGTDLNHTGAARYFNAPSALSAINLTIADCGATSIVTAIAPHGCPGIHPGSAGSGAGAATLSDFTARGMGSPADTGGSCLTAIDPSTGNPLGFPCAFGGINGNFGVMDVLQSLNRSVYNAAQLKLVETTANPFPAIRTMNLQLSYTYSEFEAPVTFEGNTPPANAIMVTDLSLAPMAADNDQPLRYMGPALFDRTQQLQLATTVDIRGGFHAGLVGHFSTYLSSPTIAGATGSGGQIYQTDFTGSGVGSQPIPGTKNGAFMRSLDLQSFDNILSYYNATVAGLPTPAGQALIGTNLITQQQLQAIGGVAPTVPAAAGDQLIFPWLILVDLHVSWTHTFRDRFKLEPSIGVFNVFNIANFDLPPAVTSSWLDEGVNSINSTHTIIQPGELAPDSNTFRSNYGTGTFSPGSPRAVEWGLRLTF